MLARFQGADLVFVVCSPAAAQPIKGYNPELIVLPLLRESADIGADATPSTSARLWAGDSREGAAREAQVVACASQIQDMFPRFSALVVGPGLGRDALVLDIAADVIRRARAAGLPLVVDGDGLFLLSRHLDLLRGYDRCVLTPNGMEFSRLWEAAGPSTERCSAFDLRAWTRGEEAQVAGGHARALADALGGPVVVQKGAVDRVAAPGCVEEAVCATPGCPRRCGGQGDVLAGLAGTFLSWAERVAAAGGAGEVEGLAPRVAAALSACRLTRRAGRQAFLRHKRSTTAPHVLAEVETVLEEDAPVG